MNFNKENASLEEVNWAEINREACDEATLNDMSGWYELD